MSFSYVKRLLVFITLALFPFAMRSQQWLPRYGDSFWHDSIPNSMRQSYVSFGERFIGTTWEDLPNIVFAEYKKNGNRSHYESLLFEKRRRLAALVMAEIVEGKGRFISDINRGLESTLKEIWWGVPAHYDTDVPLHENQVVDIINAETASLVAYTRYVLFEELNLISPKLVDRIDKEINRRILEPAMKSSYWWKNSTSNWNPWICSNWLACVLFCEHDDLRKQNAIEQIVKASDFFFISYPDDGGCDEGPMYWDRAAASLFEVYYLLSMSKCVNSIDFRHPKLKAMGSYIYKMYAGNGHVINFSDTYGYRARININIGYPFGKMIGDNELCQYSAWYGQQNDELHRSSLLFDQSGNWPSLGRELIFLTHIQSFLEIEACEPKINDVWLQNLQIMTARTSSASPLFVAFKGGHNDEQHNHNDVGSYIVYCHGEPLLIDLGVGEYSAKTFSNGRYEICSMQSDYHNLPRINGYSQREGRQYKAQVIERKPRQLTLDLSKAYPEEAKIEKWHRTVSIKSRDKITITEAFKLSAYNDETQLMLITTVKPVINSKGLIILNNCEIRYKPNQMTPIVENIANIVDSGLRRVWGNNIYRIVLNVRSHKLNQRLHYTISSNRL